MPHVLPTEWIAYAIIAGLPVLLFFWVRRLVFEMRVEHGYKRILRLGFPIQNRTPEQIATIIIQYNDDLDARDIDRVATVVRFL